MRKMTLKNHTRKFHGKNHSLTFAEKARAIKRESRAKNRGARGVNQTAPAATHANVVENVPHDDDPNAVVRGRVAGRWVCFLCEAVFDTEVELLEHAGSHTDEDEPLSKDDEDIEEDYE
jgi:hypothetical protein